MARNTNGRKAVTRSSKPPGASAPSDQFATTDSIRPFVTSIISTQRASYIPYWVERCAIVALALAILTVRVPTYFTYPQFWAEDALIWVQSYTDGIRALLFPMAGYLLLGPKLIGAFAQLFPIAYAPAVYIYSAVAVDLAIVWLATSPRLDLPYKAGIALAIVVPMHGIYALGTVANIQWVFPLGIFFLLFMRPAGKIVIAIEAAFVAVFTLTGPTCFFVAPLFLLRLISAKREQSSRLIVLSAVAVSGAAVQAVVVFLHRGDTMIVGLEPRWTITEFVVGFYYQALAPIGSSIFQAGALGLMAALLVSVGIAWGALITPLRSQKLLLLLLAGAIATVGQYKIGPTFVLSYNLRYFYIAAVALIWFLLCLAAHQKLRPLFLSAAAALGIFGFVASINSESVRDDLHWEHWSSLFDSGLPVTFASSPASWYLEIPADPAGPLAGYANWIGKPIGEMPLRIEPCEQTAVLSAFPAVSARYTNIPHLDYYTGDSPRWTITVRPAGQFQMLAVLDRDQRVIGFALPSWEGDTWRAIVPAKSRDTLRVIGIRSPSAGCILGDSLAP